MAEYSVRFTRSARKELEALPKVHVKRVFPRVESLSIDPRPKGSRKLSGEKHLWRIRVGHYRVVYSINDEERIVDIMVIRHRSHAYK